MLNIQILCSEKSAFVCVDLQCGRTCASVTTVDERNFPRAVWQRQFNGRRLATLLRNFLTSRRLRYVTNLLLRRKIAYFKDTRYNLGFVLT